MRTIFIYPNVWNTMQYFFFQENSAEPDPAPEPSQEPTPGPSEGYRCRRCTAHFSNRRDLYLHGMQHHYQSGAGAMQARPWANGEAPWEIEADGPLKTIYEANAPLILDSHQESSVSSTYNVPLTNDFSIPQLMEHAERIYDRQGHAFRLNLEFGLILRHAETGEYRYFRPYANESMFERPIYISRRKDLNRLRLRLQRFNVTDFILRQRPDTKWKPYLVTNVRFVLYHLNYPLGRGVQLPDYIKTSKSIVGLDRNREGMMYQDNLCAFRCLAVHQGHHKDSLETHTKALYDRWVQFAKDKHMDVYDRFDFPGLPLHQMAYFEICFAINVNVFQLRDDAIALTVYKSRCHYKDTMHVNLYEHHLSYINNLPAYTKKYQCGSCDRHFKDLSHMKRHQLKCTGQTVYNFKGGFYSNPKTVFDKLEEQGIHVTDPLFKWFIVYDFEAMLVPIQESNSEKLTWTQKHQPISVSICSNVPDFKTPHCIVECDLELLVRKMVDYMTRIGHKTYDLAKEKFKDAFDQLEKEITNPMRALLEDDDEDEFKLDAFLDDEELQEENDKEKNVYHKLKDELDAYCRQTIVLGFNSAKYDVNLIKTRLAQTLQMDSPGEKFTVKRNNSYACLANDKFKFLDVTSYLAPGVSYAKFLKAFDVDENKGFFPYEWFDGPEKLQYSQLPPHAAFHSSLKDSNITEEEYHFCQRVWTEQGMTTFQDFLIWYNNLDVAPMVKAVENLQKFYFERGIDLFKTSISVPGLARRMLFDTGRQAGASFALFDEANSDLYFSIKNNLTGGPSIIFNRHHEVGQTYIRNNRQKPCQKILGFDANALYLFSIDQDMPTGSFVRRRLENGFKPQKRDRFTMMFDWMQYLNHTQGLHIQHKLNTGKEKKIGPYPVDGFDPNTNTVYQFHGCYWHGHQCWMTKHIKDQKWQEGRQAKYDKTAKTTTLIRSQGYEVVEKWECQFRNDLRRDLALKDFCDARKPPTPQRSVTEDEILEAVMKGRLFGMVECDIRVPEEWPAYFRHPTMTPYQYFEEMSPLFCTTDVPFDIIGEHMQDHVRRFQLSEKPRRLLVGGMRARQMLIATPLLKWYLEHGMAVTKIYQVVEYTPHRCFRDFVQEVSDNRRLGDAHPDKAIIADTSKLHGNSAYGGTIMDQEKFQSVTYVKGEGQVMIEANKPQFKKLSTLLQEEEYFEVEKSKEQLNINLPIQIGYFILQYAKLRMLQFYYDFLDVYVDRADFQYCEMDTDSAYMALSGPSLVSVVKPHMCDAYQRALTGSCRDDLDPEWFPRTCCSKHAKYDKRTPGLFKVEYEGDVMIGLCSKTYIVQKTRTVQSSSTTMTASKLLRRAKKLPPKRLVHRPRLIREVKFSSKGITKRRVKAPMTTFRHVLQTQRVGQGTLKGFRARNNGISTYQQTRNGFSYFYCKRRVLHDGVSTVPLDLELCPVRKDPREETQMEVDEPIREETPMEVDLDEHDRYLIHLLETNFESDSEQ